MRMLPVVMRNFLQRAHNLRRIHFNRQLSPAVKAAWRQIDRAHNRPLTIRQQHLPVQLQMLQFVYLDSDIVQNSQPADALG